MKKLKKLIAGFIGVIICFSIYGCGEKNKSNIDILKEYSLMDENICVVNEDGNVENKTVGAITGNILEQPSKTYIYKKNDNRVQYIVECTIKTNNSEVTRAESYVIEFRDDGIYSSDQRNHYEKVEDVENLIDTVDDSYFNRITLKMPLEVGTTWDYNEAKDGTMKIEKVNNKGVEVTLRGKTFQGKERLIETYKKGMGPSDGVGYNPDGSIRYKDTSKIEERESSK